MELKNLIKKRIEENVPDFDITKVERYEYLFEMIAIEFASEQVKSPIIDVRQVLIDFLQHMWETDFDRKGLAFDDYVDEFLIKKL